MSIDLPRTRAVAETLPGVTHQLYSTHCLYDEGMTRAAGFAVRASSTRDPLLLRFAHEYPPYEVSSSETGPSIRLALVRVPGGPMALIHSVAIPGENHGRANNFFSHVLVRPSWTACDALRLWGSADWVRECPPLAGKDLEPLSAFGRGPLDDRAVTDFLRPDAIDSTADPFCPERVGRDIRRRRELLSLTIRGCLLASREPTGSPQGRFFLVAEPPLAALLIYGALRLLPPQFGEAATFSTSEGMRPSLRTYQHARVVGTWAGRPGQTLDEEFFAARGYAFDTERMHCSEELRRELDPAIDDWLDLAAEGEWDLLDTVYRMLGDTATSVVSFHQGFQAAKLTQRLAKGKAEARDLIALKHSPLGAGLLERHREAVWPLVRDAALPDSVLREEFGDVLAGHIPELEQQVSGALRGGSPNAWRPGWRLLRLALSENPQRLRECLQRILPPPPFAPDLRFALLSEFRGLELLPLNQQLPLHSLLRQCGPADLARFAASDLPREWQVWALFYSLIKGEAQAEAVRQLDVCDDPFLAMFWEQFAFLKEEAQRRAILAPLVAPRGGKHVLFFERSLGALAGVRAGTVEWILDALGALGRDWADFWGSGDHLARLLDVLRALGDEAEPVWDRLLRHLDPGLFLRASPFQGVLLVNLSAAATRPGPPVPPNVARVIADYVILHGHFESACGIPPEDRPAIIAACARLKLDAVAILRRYFEKYLLPADMSPQRIADFVEFFHSFYPDGTDFQAHASRLVGWREVVSACPPGARREAYLDHYTNQSVPPEFRARLAHEVFGRDKARQQPPVENPPPVAVTPVEPIEEPPAPSEDHTAYRLTGIFPAGGPKSILGAWLKGSPWLLVPFAGGFLAAAALDFFDTPSRPMALAYSFLPLVWAMADAVALQAVAIRIRWSVAGEAARPSLAQCLAGGVKAGAVLGVGGGALATGAALLLGRSTVAAAGVGAAVSGGMLSAAVLGLVLPIFFGPARERRPVAIGPIVRILAVGIALGLYVLALRWLAR